MNPPVISSSILRMSSSAVSRALSPDLVDKGWRSVGVAPEVIGGAPCFLPYQVEAEMLESVARSAGDRHLGAVALTHLCYDDLGPYARYVLTAPDLAQALARADRALRFILRGASVGICVADCHVVLGYDSGIGNVLGARHVREGIPLFLRGLVRRFLGATWVPAWIELPMPAPRDAGRLEQIYGAPVRWNRPRPAIAMDGGALTAPRAGTAPDPGPALVLGDLRRMLRAGQPRDHATVVADMIRMRLSAGDVSEETVAERLGMGVRTLQRRLQAEGPSFRALLNRERLRRAADLLEDTQDPVSAIAQSLGYSEVNSFRRAFRERTGLTPTAYRRRNAPGGAGAPS